MAHTPPGKTRQKVYEFMRKRILSNNPPTTREVQQQFGFKAVQSARQHLEALVNAGKLTKLAGKARGYRLPLGPGAAGPLRLVPLLGRVQAGALSEAIEDPDGYIPLDDRPANEELFALTVRGESMLGAGILPGDTVIVRRQVTARDGEIVVAMVGDEATVKRLRLRAGRVELHPENEAFQPIILSDEGRGSGEQNLADQNPVNLAQILGRVVEVRRKLT